VGITRTSTRRRRSRVGAVLIAGVLIAAACSDKKDQESVGGGDTVATETTGPATTTAETTAPTASTPSSGTTGDTTGSTTEETSAPTTEPPVTILEQATLPPPEGDPVMGGRLVVAGEAEVGAPWTPAAVQCDSYCQMRIRTFLEPLVVADRETNLHGLLAESVEPNDDYTEFTIKVRQGISFTDGTPLNADAVIDNFNRTFAGLLVSGATKDIAKNPDGTVKSEKIDDYTLKIFTGKNGNPNKPISWYQFPYLLTGQAGFIASPKWLAAVDGNPDLATQPVGTGPFIVQSYLPGDRMTVTKNPDYWRKDAQGNQLPYLDEIEFRVIVEDQVGAQALEAGDIDIFATSDPPVVSQFVDNPDFVTLQQDVRTETNYVMFHLTNPVLQSREVRCALVQGVDKQDLIDTVYGGFSRPANGPFSPGQDGYLEDTGLPEYDPDAARAAIEDYEAKNGPVTINYSTTPTGTTKAIADYLQSAWGDIGVDVTQTPIEQSVLITNALLGSPDFEAFGWRNHAGLWVDTQYWWWHGFAADAKGGEAKDGAIALNFGRLNDPVINDLLDEARSEPDPSRRIELAQDINREFGKECWILPTSWTTWGIIMNPSVQNIGRDPLPDGEGAMADGAGFPGQVWLTSVYKTG
jgi:peptide/nickel transport system substrate-binding protein